MGDTVFTSVRFPNDHLAQECRFVLTQDIDPGSNFDGIVVIDSQYDEMCGGHAVNNLLQHRRIDRCHLKNRADIDEVVGFIKEADPYLQAYSCDKPHGIRVLEAGVISEAQLSDEYPVENKSDHVYKNSEIALENIKRNLDLVIGFIEFDGGHYVCWVRGDNGYWYRIDSRYEGRVGNMGGSVCKFTTENMLRYVELLPVVHGDELFKGACRLIVVTLQIFEGLHRSSFRRERESRSLPPPTYEELMRIRRHRRPILPQEEDDGWASPLPINYTKRRKNKKSRKGKKDKKR